jgi:hypothetical protein
VKTTILENLQTVCQILSENQIEYLTIGGAAVALHGYDRYSKDSAGKDTKVDDLDFWYNPTYDNYFRLLNALEKLNEDVSEFRAEKIPDPKRSFFRLQRPKYTLDFLPVVPGLPRFRQVFAAREIVKLGDLEIPCINYDYLIQIKQTLGRLKDLEDIRQLRLMRSNRQQRPPRPQ